MIRSFKSADLIDLIKLSIDHPVFVFSKNAEISTGFLSSRGERVNSARYDEYQNAIKYRKIPIKSNRQIFCNTMLPLHFARSR